MFSVHSVVFCLWFVETIAEIKPNSSYGYRKLSITSKTNKCEPICFHNECTVECEDKTKARPVCFGDFCESMAQGNASASQCFGIACYAQCTGYCKSNCVGTRCYSVANRGNFNQANCFGEDCKASCHSDDCTAQCIGKKCSASCQGTRCSSNCQHFTMDCVAKCEGTGCKQSKSAFLDNYGAWFDLDTFFSIQNKATQPEIDNNAEDITDEEYFKDVFK